MSDADKTQAALALRQEHPDWGYIRIGQEIGLHKDKVRRAIEHAERKGIKSQALIIEPQTAPEFAAAIAACWRKSVEAIFEVGRLLAAAKARLQHGEFTEMIDAALPFGPRTAQRLMAIAADGRLANPTLASVLPPDWTCLYEVSRLDTPALQAKIADGTINPEMGRRNIATVVKQQKRAEKETALGAKTVVASVATEQEWPRHEAENALRVGRAAEHLVCADALMRGWNAFLSGQGSPYDVVFEKDGRMLRVQVKAAQAPRNVNSAGLNERVAYSFAALRRGKNGEGPRLTRKEADLMACVALDIGAIAYLPVADCSSTIQLEPDTVRENGYVRTYDGSIRQYPLDRAIARLEGEQHYLELRKIFPPFPVRRFNVIYADCPWSFETWSQNGMDRSADNHYPTVSTDLLCGIGPYIPAADDAVLFLWATSPMLHDAVRVMRAWGFNYKTSAIWHKDRASTGYWFRNIHETLLVGTRGDIPAPAPGTQSLSIFDAPLGRHSEKPTSFRIEIERLFPHASKLEMFARGAPPQGWQVWGLESDEAAA